MNSKYLTSNTEKVAEDKLVWSCLKATSNVLL